MPSNARLAEFGIGATAVPVAEPCGRLSPVSPAAALSAEFRQAWDALALCASDPNPFFESWFLCPALRHLDPQSTVRLMAFEVQGRLAGILPLHRRTSYYGYPLPHLAGWTHPNAFLGAPLVAKGHERSFWDALLAWCDDHARTALFLHLNDVPLDGPVTRALLDVAADQHRVAAIVHRAERAALYRDAAGAMPADLALSSKERGELRRKTARLGDQGTIAFGLNEAHPTDIGQWIDAFLALESAGWKGQAGSALASRPDTAALFREALVGAAEHGRLARLSLTLNGKPIAMMANFLTAPGAYGFKSAYDETHARHSPGLLLLQAATASAAAGQLAWFDSCTTPGQGAVDRHWPGRRRIGRISVAIGGGIRRRLFQTIVRAELARNPG